MDGASAKSVITIRVKPSDLWCRLPREVFGNTIPQKLCIAGLRMAFSITALVTGVAAGEEKGRSISGRGEAAWMKHLISQREPWVFNLLVCLDCTE